MNCITCDGTFSIKRDSSYTAGSSDAGLVYSWQLEKLEN